MTAKQVVLKLHKKIGETPLECLNRFKKDNPEYAGDKMTYAGRLDPLASGLLLILVGDECKQKDKYLGLDKEYELDVLFGIATDTQDVLGLVCKNKTKENILISKTKLTKKLKNFVGKTLQAYPAYSSKTVKGKTLFSLAKAGKIDSIKDWPQKEIEIYNIRSLGWEKMKPEELQKLIKEKISLVKGDFRQDKILKCWDKYFQNNSLPTYLILKLKVGCSSGAYMRSLAENIGQSVGQPALALNIKRTKLGKYKN